MQKKLNLFWKFKFSCIPNSSTIIATTPTPRQPTLSTLPYTICHCHDHLPHGYHHHHFATSINVSLSHCIVAWYPSSPPSSFNHCHHWLAILPLLSCQVSFLASLCDTLQFHHCLAPFAINVGTFHHCHYRSPPPLSPSSLHPFTLYYYLTLLINHSCRLATFITTITCSLHYICHLVSYTTFT